MASQSTNNESSSKYNKFQLYMFDKSKAQHRKLADEIEKKYIFLVVGATSIECFDFMQRARTDIDLKERIYPFPGSHDRCYNAAGFASQSFLVHVNGHLYGLQIVFREYPIESIISLRTEMFSNMQGLFACYDPEQVHSCSVPVQYIIHWRNHLPSSIEKKVCMAVGYGKGEKQKRIENATVVATERTKNLLKDGDLPIFQHILVEKDFKTTTPIIQRVLDQLTDWFQNETIESSTDDGDDY